MNIPGKVPEHYVHVLTSLVHLILHLFTCIFQKMAIETNTLSSLQPENGTMTQGKKSLNGSTNRDDVKEVTSETTSLNEGPLKETDPENGEIEVTGETVTRVTNTGETEIKKETITKGTDSAEAAREDTIDPEEITFEEGK